MSDYHGDYNSILFISAWYDENAINEGFGNMAWETLSKECLDKLFTKFYVEMRRQDGKPYSKGAYISIRNGLQRHLSNEPYGRNIALSSDPAAQLGILKWWVFLSVWLGRA